MLELSTRGIRILQNLAAITGEQEINNLAIEERAKNVETSVSFWLKVRNVLSSWLG